MSKRKNRPNRCDPRQVGLRNATEYMVKSSIIGALKMYVERYGEQLTEQDINAFGLGGGREGEDRRRGRGAAVEILRLRERRHRVGRRLGARPRPHRTAASKRWQSDACIDYAEREQARPTGQRLRVSEGRVMPRIDYAEVTEQREQTKVSLSVCRVATELAEGNVSRLDRQVNAAPRHPLPHPHRRSQDVRRLSISARLGLKE